MQRLVVVFLLAGLGTLTQAAPAPFPKPKGKLPYEIQFVLNSIEMCTPDWIQREEALLKLRLTEKERQIRLREVEKIKRDYYTDPIDLLEYGLKKYRGAGEQQAMKRELKKHRERLEEAKKKGLFK